VIVEPGNVAGLAAAYMFMLIGTALVFWGLNGITCAIVASQRGRDPIGWFFLGLFFSPWAIIWICAMKSREPKVYQSS
jgi:hypothetical protein